MPSEQGIKTAEMKACLKIFFPVPVSTGFWSTSGVLVIGSTNSRPTLDACKNFFNTNAQMVWGTTQDDVCRWQWRRSCLNWLLVALGLVLCLGRQHELRWHQLLGAQRLLGAQWRGHHRHHRWRRLCCRRSKRVTPSHMHDLLCVGHGTRVEMPFHAAQETSCSCALTTNSTAGPCAAQGWN